MKLLNFVYLKNNYKGEKQVKSAKEVGTYFLKVKQLAGGRILYIFC